MSLTAVLAVGVGGFCGGVARWALGVWPGGLRGTFAANLLAVIVLGAALGAGGVTSLAWGTGFAGALSTWSTLAREIGGLLRARRFRLVAGYTTATLTAGVAVAWLMAGLF
ncbi:MAG: CrcB family protein [Corynebacterium humireducens]|jgi:CrcB protein|uniref:Fluoride-specific ion channel FluC n=2 Tax=Corynebacterium humireducens TaxID=1223514 RepID=A0A0B5DCT3_9CORY|nr:CrcB family protein [Corynebacterium humireducens]AJE33983.1 hypothetical protein B842_10670 [Corynebacterium humireducens NBRC 106098 = DSM 45392]NLA54810.1 CrcB family protein [Corynebacterium humireducens]